MDKNTYINLVKVFGQSDDFIAGAESAWSLDNGGPFVDWLGKSEQFIEGYFTGQSVMEEMKYGS